MQHAPERRELGRRILILTSKNGYSRLMADTSTAHDLLRLARWMDGEGLPGTGEIPQQSRLGGGSQNELYVVTRDGHRSIMRIPPPGADARRHDGLRREL